MFESDKKSSLDRLKKGLYSRTDRFGESPRHDIHAKRYEDVNPSWEAEEKASEEAAASEAESESPATTRIKKMYKVFLWSSFAFFIIASAIGAYTLFGGHNFVSVDNVEVLVDGPISVAGGDVLSLNASVVNKNATDIQLVDLIAEYPQGTKDATDPTKDLSRVRVSLGDISKGALAQHSFDSIMFGEQGAERDVKFTVEYRTADSNAIFYKEKVYKLTISSSPIIVSIDALDKVLSNQPTDVNVTVSSNTSVPVKDLLLDLEYPFGFSVSSSDPAPSFADNIWTIGDLAPGAKRTITLHGTVQGQDGEQRVIHANVGIKSQTDDRSIATNIISRDHTFTIEQPFFGLDLTFDGNQTDNAPVQPGANVRTDIIWKNNSSTKITNATIEAKLSGNALDRSSIDVTDGYYDSARDTIVWQAGRTPGLDSIAPGDSNRISFTFATAKPMPGQAIVNPTVQVTVSATGSRVDEAGISQDVATGIQRSVRVISNLALSARALRSQGPFTNSGPIPPKVEQATTYTVVWTVTNTSNTISNAQVTATIPAYMKWTGAVSPSDAAISYNPVGGQIVWNAGGVAQNADIGTGAKQVYFQLALTPSVTQVGTAPTIMSDSSIVGTDTFTGATIKNSAPSLSTMTTTDLFWQPGNETVQQ